TGTGGRGSAVPGVPPDPPPHLRAHRPGPRQGRRIAPVVGPPSPVTDASRGPRRCGGLRAVCLGSAGPSRPLTAAFRTGPYEELKSTRTHCFRRRRPHFRREVDILIPPAPRQPACGHHPTATAPRPHPAVRPRTGSSDGCVCSTNVAVVPAAGRAPSLPPSKIP